MGTYHDDTVSGPYAQAARLYRAAGWHGALPLGDAPGMKWPPPGNKRRGDSFTGHEGRMPSGADVEAWIETHGHLNIGVRMPHGVLGIDVDAYEKAGKRKLGDETLAALEARFGPLPPTWVSSARPAPSGIRWFRVPEGLNWPGEIGPGIELIHFGHRYAVVWPSTNPEADGARYEWRDMAESRLGSAIPSPGDLAELPESWVRGLSLSYDRAEKANLNRAGQAEWWAQLRTGTACPRVTAAQLDTVNRLEAGAEGRHEVARDAVSKIVRWGGDGHVGASAAIGVIRETFERVTAAPGRDSAGEFMRLLSGAVDIAAKENPAPRAFCACTPPAIPMPATDPAWVVPAPVAPQAYALPELPAPATDETSLDAFTGELIMLPKEKRAARSRERVTEIWSWPALDLQPWRRAMKDLGDLPVGEFDKIVSSLKAERKTQEAAAREAARLAEIQGRGGELMPGPHAPLDAAEYLRGKIDHTDGSPHRRWWRGDFYRWDGCRWLLWRDDAVDNWLYAQTRLMAFEDEDGNVADWHPSSRRIEGVAHALGRSVLWRDSDSEAEDSPDAIACANGVVTAAGLVTHHPSRFNLHSLPFPYDPGATCPEWERFLESVLPGDAQAQQFIAEWFGYVISGRTDLQKIASLFGPPRCGKGTIARVLEALLGPESVASPTLDKLATQFGEAPLIGKRLAILSDVRWNARATTEAVPILLAVSGEDARNVPRKNRDDWHGKLPVRFMAMGNDAPTFSDASGALAGRMVHVEFRTSFLGREDHGLMGRLLPELPGILNWALRGLAELTVRGRFLPPASSDEAQELVARMSSPVSAFIADRCELAPVAEVLLDDLFIAYRAWCDNEGRERRATKDTFSRDLRTATGGQVTTKQVRVGGGRVRMASGIRLVSGVLPWHGSVSPPVSPPFVP